MQTLRELFRYGMGPSSSHTMGPRRAAQMFRERYSGARRVKVVLYGSLSLSGRGHLTDKALEAGLAPLACEIEWSADTLPFHPNGMCFYAYDTDDAEIGRWTVFSTGGGELREADRNEPETERIYPQKNMNEVLQWADGRGEPIWALAKEIEGPDLWNYLEFAWDKMQASVRAGLESEGCLPGELHLQRKARETMLKAERLRSSEKRTGMISAYALAVSEHNAAGGMIVTAPTCGSCGVLPAVLHYVSRQMKQNTASTLDALATAGIIGNIIKHNASISGAEVGCQGEIGTACAMAAAAAAQALGGTPHQVEYAAEIGLEHHLGLTCDPVFGLVQVPCIERNAFAAISALAAAEYALLSDGRHLVSLDQAVEVMKRTGHDLPSLYRETALGGLAGIFQAECAGEKATQEGD